MVNIKIPSLPSFLISHLTLSLLSLHLLLSWLLCSAAVSHWNYQPGPQGPAAWDGPCQTGRSQSPINLQPEEAERGSFPPWQLRHYESLLKKAEVENNGHTLQLSPSKKEKKLPSVSGNKKWSVVLL